MDEVALVFESDPGRVKLVPSCALLSVCPPPSGCLDPVLERWAWLTNPDLCVDLSSLAKEIPFQSTTGFEGLGLSS